MSTMDFSHESWLVEFRRKLDEFDARMDGRWGALEQWCAAVKPRIGGLEQTSTELLVKADNWGGLFDEIYAPDSTSSNSSSPMVEEEHGFDLTPAVICTGIASAGQIHTEVVLEGSSVAADPSVHLADPALLPELTIRGMELEEFPLQIRAREEEVGEQVLPDLRGNDGENKFEAGQKLSTPDRICDSYVEDDSAYAPFDPGPKRVLQTGTRIFEREAGIRTLASPPHFLPPGEDEFLNLLIGVKPDAVSAKLGPKVALPVKAVPPVEAIRGDFAFADALALLIRSSPVEYEFRNFSIGGYFGIISANARLLASSYPSLSHTAAPLPLIEVRARIHLAWLLLVPRRASSFFGAGVHVPILSHVNPVYSTSCFPTAYITLASKPFHSIIGFAYTELFQSASARFYNYADYVPTKCSRYCRSGFTSMMTTTLNSSTPTWVSAEVVNSLDKLPWPPPFQNQVFSEQGMHRLAVGNLLEAESNAVWSKPPWPSPDMQVEFECGSDDLRPFAWPSFTTVLPELTVWQCYILPRKPPWSPRADQYFRPAHAKTEAITVPLGCAIGTVLLSLASLILNEIQQHDVCFEPTHLGAIGDCFPDGCFIDDLCCCVALTGCAHMASDINVHALLIDGELIQEKEQMRHNGCGRNTNVVLKYQQDSVQFCTSFSLANSYAMSWVVSWKLPWPAFKSFHEISASWWCYSLILLPAWLHSAWWHSGYQSLVLLSSSSNAALIFYHIVVVHCEVKLTAQLLHWHSFLLSNADPSTTTFTSVVGNMVKELEGKVTSQAQAQLCRMLQSCRVATMELTRSPSYYHEPRLSVTISAAWGQAAFQGRGNVRYGPSTI